MCFAPCNVNLTFQFVDSRKARPFCSFVAPDLEDRPYRITSLSYSPDAQDMLVSYSCDHLYLFGIKVSCIKFFIIILNVCELKGQWDYWIKKEW